MNPPSHVAFRLSALIFAAVLGLQSAWLLLTELSRPQIEHLPTDARSAAFAARQRSDIAWAAWIGGIRGDLWAESGFTLADLLWTGPDGTAESANSVGQVRLRIDHAISYAPHQSDAWLLWAGLESRYQWSKSGSVEALKMSYYTAPSEMRLVPLRLLIAARQREIADAEVQQFVRRDLRLLVALQQRSAVAEAYQGASPEGRRFIERVLLEIDPAYLESLRSGAQKP